jgi:streptogramin lyase
VPGPSFPVLDDAGSLWFGNGSGSTMIVRLSGDLSGTPNVTLVDTTVPSVEFPILDRHQNLWFGNTDSGGSNALVRVD